MKIRQNEKSKKNEYEESEDEESKDEDEYEYEWADIPSSPSCLINSQAIKANPNIYIFCSLTFLSLTCG